MEWAFFCWGTLSTNYNPCGASKQNRTVITCLEGRGFAIKLYLHMSGDFYLFCYHLRKLYSRKPLL